MMIEEFAVGAAVLMAAGLVLYSRQPRAPRSAPRGWGSWFWGQLGLVLLLVQVGAPPLALAAPALGAAVALPMALRAPSRTWTELLLPGAVFLWGLLLLGPVGALTLTGEIGPVFALLSALVAVAAGWPLLAALCAEPGRQGALAWFLWSAGYGLAALALMAARIDWPFLLFPLLAQALHLVAGIVAFGSSEPARLAPVPGTRGRDAEVQAPPSGA